MHSFSVVHQGYATEPINEYVIVGNDALLKCTIPSFVVDFVEVVAWVDSEGKTFSKNENFIGIHFCIVGSSLKEPLTLLQPDKDSLNFCFLRFYLNT